MKKIGKNAKLYLIGMIIGGMTLGLTTVIADTIINSTNVSYKTTTVKAALDDLYGLTADDIWKKIYPVGSIYISVSSTSPGTLFGGTWVAFGQGRTLLGMGAVEANTRTDQGVLTAGAYHYDEVEAKGGEYVHTLTIAEMPQHRHPSLQQDGLATSTGASVHLNTCSASISTCLAAEAGDIVVPFVASGSSVVGTKGWVALGRTAGNSLAHNNMQPYITVYMWKRTA